MAVAPFNANELNLRSAGDLKRFNEMVENTKRRAFSMAIRLTRNATEAEDLLQETYLKAWKGFDGYISSKPFLNWFLRIMQRAYLDARRRDNPIRKAESLNSMVSPHDGEVQELIVADTGLSPEDELIRQELWTHVASALEQMPNVYSQAIVMCDMEGRTYAEIAKMQNTTVGTVRSRIHRGRRLLRDSIEQGHYQASA